MSNSNINKLIDIVGVALEKKLNSMKVELLHEMRVMIRQELNDKLQNSSDHDTPINKSSMGDAKPMKEKGESDGDYDISAIKQRLTEAQNIGKNIENNENIYFDENGNAQDMSNINDDKVNKIKQNVKRDYSELI